MCVVSTPLEELAGATDVDEDNDAGDQTVANIPKCLSCGAPQPTSTTHYRFKNKILCYLCGEISSILREDQQEIREDEYLDKDLYNKFEHLSPQEKRKKKNEEKGDIDEDDADYDEDFDFSTDAVELRMPVSQGADPSEAIWQFPAMACPPVWWIIVDGTVGNATTVGASRNYWTTVGSTISKALEDIPPHVHVGLLTASGSRLASWDLTSPVPHVQQYKYSYDPLSKGESDASNVVEESEPWDLCLVPANGHYKSNIEAAIRGMVDGGTSGVFLEGDNDNGEEKKTDGESTSTPLVPLGLTLEILLEFMEQGKHPGQTDDNETEGKDTLPRYAGGKILCLLGNPTLETGTPPRNDSLSYMSQPDFGLGGVAGACGCDDISSTSAKRFPGSTSKKKSSGKGKGKKEEETDPTDMTISNLSDYVLSLEPDDLFAIVGRRCAKAALGVDVIVLVPEEDDDAHSSQTIPWYGLPLLRPLSDASGAPGPLMFGTGNVSKVDESSDDENSPDSQYIENFERLHENILARTPWQSGMVFGVQTKLRLSPGLALEDSPLKTKVKKGQIDLSKFLGSGGMSGPASLLVDEDGNDGGKPTGSPEDKMWIMGSCDPHTSFVFDLEHKGELPDSYEMDGQNPIAARPVIQTCTLFTSIETDGAQPTPNYFTVTKMRVSSVALNATEDVESIFDGLDPEALSVVLTNKIALDTYLDGFVAAQKNVESWTSSVMEAAYLSAQAQEAKMEEGEDSDFEFDACDRLLDQDGAKLNETDILLAEGHFKLRFIPLLSFAIMQSDAFRPSGKGYKPSMDARLCALTQLSSMTPKSLASTLAPSLSLWSLKDDKALIDTLPLSKNGIIKELKDIDEASLKSSVLLLESTQALSLFTTDNLHELSSKKKESFWNQYLTIGPNLRETIDGALSGYRTCPPQWKALEEVLESNRYVDLQNLDVPFTDLSPMMVEDKPTFGGEKNYFEWRSKMAGMVKNEVHEEGGENKGRRGVLRLIFGGK